MEHIAYLGIDVAKGSADFLLVNARKVPLEDGFVLDDCSQGREKVTELIEQWFASGITQLYCGVESTGGYENNWFRLLCRLAGKYQKKDTILRVSRVNPRAVKACGQAGMLRTQTDQTSALAIASYLIGFPEKIRYSPNMDHAEDPMWLAARGQAGLTHMLIKQKTQLSNQLEKLLYSHLGELMVYCRHRLPLWMLRLLSRYPGRERLRRAGLKKVAGINGISSDKAQSLLGKLDSGQSATPPIACHTIKASARQILHLQSQIDTQQTYLIRQFKDHSDVKLLESITGIGQASAVGLIVQIEDYSRFEASKSFCAYFGVHPVWKESGDGHWKMGMSKQGRGQVRAILYMSSLSAIRWDPDMKKLYHRFRKKKRMNHYQAMGVLMHKLLRIIYGVLKNQTPYDRQIDRNNRRRSQQKSQAYQQKAAAAKTAQKTTRQRYMSNRADSTEDAPISRRAYKKRKQEASQRSKMEEHAGSPPVQNPNNIP